ncbi:nitroreductase family protein [Cupriavidus lacunae]|uniref:Nitroreductase family protein n=1 Tax=Cupriavidus lacunae TaxID=2666307 RepID=A0A370NI28_9BURK|nr:nitroreductase family protein [Cupriavidus lacunae]RDK05245.1 nitroreductase family protein [Cupriavidus lacunae]
MSQPRTSEHDIHPLFLQRWSPRAFTGEAIDEATLLRFFEAARWAPSGYNAQPWRFLYARRDTPEWQPVFAALSEYNQGWATRASALVVILSRKVWTPPGKTEPQAITTHSFDAGAAWANLALQVTLSGWHAHGIGGFDQDALRDALNVPQDYAIEAVAAIGKQGDKAQLPEALQAREYPNQRHPLRQLVSQGRFTFETE